MNPYLLRQLLGLLVGVFLLTLLGPVAQGSDRAGAVEQLLKTLRQDQPVPAQAYLKKTTPVNADSAYYIGRYQGIDIAVETHPHSPRIASVLLKISGPDRTAALLPAVSRVIGKPHHSEPKKSQYAWEWRNYRSASVHYVAGERQTIVSLYYR